MLAYQRGLITWVVWGANQNKDVLSILSIDYINDSTWLPQGFLHFTIYTVFYNKQTSRYQNPVSG